MICKITSIKDKTKAINMLDITYLFKVNNENNRIMCGICSKLITKTSEAIISEEIEVI